MTSKKRKTDFNVCPKPALFPCKLCECETCVHAKIRSDDAFNSFICTQCGAQYSDDGRHNLKEDWAVDHIKKLRANAKAGRETAIENRDKYRKLYNTVRGALTDLYGALASAVDIDESKIPQPTPDIAIAIASAEAIRDRRTRPTQDIIDEKKTE